MPARSGRPPIAKRAWGGPRRVATAATFLYGEHLNLAAVGGMVLIVAGVVVIVSSGATSHS
jgi:small multidrug resistance pump